MSKKLIKKRKSTFIFFIIAYMVIILTFSVGLSAINSQKNKMKKVNPEYNKTLHFLLKEGAEDQLINTEEIIKLLEKEKVSLILKRTENTGNVIESYLLTNGVFYEEDMKKGTYLTKEEFAKNKEKVVFSNNFIGDKKLKLINENGEIEEKTFTDENVTYEKEAKITIPIEMFKNYGGGIDFNDPSLRIIVSGEVDDLNKAIAKVKEDIEKNYSSLEFKSYDYLLYDRESEWKLLAKTTIMIIFVTLISSIGIASLWIEERKKELIIRKVVGAGNLNLVKIFFKELSFIAIIAMIFSILTQLLLSLLTGGYLLDMNIKITAFNLIGAILVTLISTLVTTIPFLIYLMKISPVEMLREE